MADVESTIRMLEERLWRAQLSADVETLDELIADDLVFSVKMDAAALVAGQLISAILRYTRIWFQTALAGRSPVVT
jgi:hypothetical protein